MKHFSLLFLFIIFLSCESPFATKPTEGDVFEVTQDYNGEKIYHPTAVTIEWSNITIKNFKEFLVERSITIGDSTIWEERARILDSLSTVYTDTIDDDATFQYRVQIVDKDDQFIVAHSEPLIVPNVQALRVPNDYENPQNAFDSKFIDDGDTVKIYPGLYQGHFEFMDKDAVIRAITIPEITLFGADVELGSVVKMNRDTLEGLTIIGGFALSSGGFIIGNTSRADIMNCVFFRNRTFSSTYSGAIVNFGNVSILNTVVWKNGGEIDYRLYPRSATYTDSDEFRVQSGTGNINTDPFFENPSNGNFHLQSDSPCINAGNTDSIYNNSNGSRNDMGIYGGPYGDDW